MRYPSLVAQILDINIISSPTGGAEAVSYDRETTIGRICQTIEAVLTTRVSRGQISALSVRVRKKPAGAVRKAARGLAGVRMTNFQLRISPGDFTDMSRDALVYACKEAVPGIVCDRVPADHLCSLVIAFKDNASTDADRLS